MYFGSVDNVWVGSVAEIAAGQSKRVTLTYLKNVDPNSRKKERLPASIQFECEIVSGTGTADNPETGIYTDLVFDDISALGKVSGRQKIDDLSLSPGSGILSSAGRPARGTDAVPVMEIGSLRIELKSVLGVKGENDAQGLQVALDFTNTSVSTPVIAAILRKEQIFIGPGSVIESKLLDSEGQVWECSRLAGLSYACGAVKMSGDKIAKNIVNGKHQPEASMYFGSVDNVWVGSVAEIPAGQSKRVTLTYFKNVDPNSRKKERLPASIQFECEIVSGTGTADNPESCVYSDVMFDNINTEKRVSAPRADSGNDLSPAGLNPAPANENVVAVIIGIKNYKNQAVPAVDYALNDAKMVKEYMIKLLGCREENIIYLEDPSKGELEAVFGTKDSNKGKLNSYIRAGKSDVIVYYAGHGAPDLDSKYAFLVPSDGNPDYVALNGYSLDLLFSNVDSLDVRSATVIIEACFSGAVQNGMLIKNASPLAVVPETKKYSGKLNILAASSSSEIASWYPEKSQGLFTYFLLKGLGGACERNSDNAITFGALRDYTAANVSAVARRLYGRSQTVSFSGEAEGVVLK